MPPVFVVFDQNNDVGHWKSLIKFLRKFRSTGRRQGNRQSAHITVAGDEQSCSQSGFIHLTYQDGGRQADVFGQAMNSLFRMVIQGSFH